jgi:polysaccharide pyruvyl transferase WcaK-like protein
LIKIRAKFMFNYDKSASSTIFGYLGFDNYGDELLAQTLIRKFALENYSFLSKKQSIFGHLAHFFKAKQVFAIGGLFQDQTSFFSLFYYCVILRLFQIFGKKIYLVSVGVGPLEKEYSKYVLYTCLKRFENISVRDDYSKNLLAEVNINSILSKDLAWDNEALNSKEASNEKTLICIRNENDWLLVKERFEFEDFDLLLMQKEFDLAHKIKDETKEMVDVIDAFAFEYKDLLKKISSYDKLISSRYHGAILGFLAKTDVKILEISPKLSSLLNTIAEA